MFASAKRVEITMYAGTMLALTFVWCWMAQYLVQHPKWGAPIRRYAAPATPFILVLLGLYILFK
jgi:cadmium resistance protein CadD (predicted permease)